jgi:hypothetical protein
MTGEQARLVTDGIAQIERELDPAAAGIAALKDVLDAFDDDPLFDVVTVTGPDGLQWPSTRMNRQPDPTWELDVGEVIYHCPTSLDRLIAPSDVRRDQHGRPFARDHPSGGHAGLSWCRPGR